MSQDKVREFQPIFYPRSIAVVGASRNMEKPGTSYVQALLQAGYKGKVYVVNPSGEEILGLKSYPTVSSIPETVDFVIVSVPVRLALSVLEDCAAKKVKTVQLFTAGFGETGTAEGRRLEEEAVRQARAGGFRIIGPNCIGIYNPLLNIPCGPTNYLGKPGPISFASQSGGHALNVMKAGMARGLGFSKVVSFGNGCDLDSVDYLEYFAADPETKIIAAYLEGVREGQRLFSLLKEITLQKPVVIWKGGKTPEGAEAAASHTGSLAASEAVWRAALRQAGTVKVENLEEMVDILLALSYLGRIEAHNIAIVAGLVDGGGGDSVSATDACVSLGLKVPPFTARTKDWLRDCLPLVGSILRNPLDVGATGGNWQNLEKVIEAVAAEPQIDLVIIQEHVDNLIRLLDKERAYRINDMFIELSRRLPKPLVVVSPPGVAEAERVFLEQKLSMAEIPVYPTLERAAKALANLNQIPRQKTEA